MGIRGDSVLVPLWGGVPPQRRQCRRAIRCAFPLRQLTVPLDSRHSVSIHPYIRWVPSLGIVALHPPVTLHISPLGHGAGVQRHPRRCVYSSGAVPPRPDPIAMCSLKGSERARLRARAMQLPQIDLCLQRDISASLHSQIREIRTIPATDRADGDKRSSWSERRRLG